MAERRMFSKTIIDSDLFLDMPLSTQSLYFHLSMRADDDGFVNNPKKIQRMIGCSEDDLKLLIAKQFLIPFESGVCVIKHWRIHNYIRGDRYKPTVYQEEKSKLHAEKNNVYTLEISENNVGIPNDNQMDTQVRIGKDRLGKVRLGKDNIYKDEADKKKTSKHKYGEYKHVLLTDEQHTKLINEFGTSVTNDSITFLDEYIEMKGYKAKNHYLCIKKWVVDAVKEKQLKANKNTSSSTQNLKQLFKEAEDEENGISSDINDPF